MAKITIHAGDFLEGESSLIKSIFTGEYVLFLRTEKDCKHPGELLLLDKLQSIEIASEESVKKVGGTLGWGVAGAVVLGPVGLLAGLLLGGKKKDVTFVAKFKDGRKLLATTDSKSYTRLQAAVF